MKLSVSLSRTAPDLFQALPSREFAPEISHNQIPYNSNLMRWLYDEFDNIKKVSISAFYRDNQNQSNLNKIELVTSSLNNQLEGLAHYNEDGRSLRLGQSISKLISNLNKIQKYASHFSIDKAGEISMRLKLTASIINLINHEKINTVCSRIIQWLETSNDTKEREQVAIKSLEEKEQILKDKKSSLKKLEQKVDQVSSQISLLASTDLNLENNLTNTTGQKLSKNHGKKQRQEAELKKHNLENELTKLNRLVVAKQNEISKASESVIKAKELVNQQKSVSESLSERYQEENLEYLELLDNLNLLASNISEILEKHFLINETRCEEERILSPIWEEVYTTAIGAVSLRLNFNNAERVLDITLQNCFPYSSKFGEMFDKDSLKDLAEGVLDNIVEFNTVLRGSNELLAARQLSDFLLKTMNYFSYIFEHGHYPYLKEQLKDSYPLMTDGSFRNWLRGVFGGLLGRIKLWNQIQETHAKQLPKGESRSVGDAKDLISCIYLFSASVFLNKNTHDS